MSKRKASRSRLESDNQDLAAQLDGYLLQTLVFVANGRVLRLISQERSVQQADDFVRGYNQGKMQSEAPAVRGKHAISQVLKSIRQEGGDDNE